VARREPEIIVNIGKRLSNEILPVPSDSASPDFSRLIEPSLYQFKSEAESERENCKNEKVHKKKIRVAGE
jgi:hypothetical protein